MFKKAWLVKERNFGEDGEYEGEWLIVLNEPRPYQYQEVKEVVYQEVDAG